MISKFTAKGFKISESAFRHINYHLKKFTRLLPNLNPDLPRFNFFIRKNISRYHLKRHYHHYFTNYLDRKGALAFFEGSVNLKLPKKPLIVRFKGQKLNECVDRGIKTLKKELQKYKDLHFKAQSEYPDHQSIRKENFYD